MLLLLPQYRSIHAIRRFTHNIHLFSTFDSTRFHDYGSEYGTGSVVCKRTPTKIKKRVHFACKMILNFNIKAKPNEFEKDMRLTSGQHQHKRYTTASSVVERTASMMSERTQETNKS